MSEKIKYVLIYTDGRAENAKDSYGWYDILDHVYTLHSTAGGGQALPDKLLKNGAFIVPQGLCSVAWNYMRYLQKLHEAASKDAREKFPEPNEGVQK